MRLTLLLIALMFISFFYVNIHNQNNIETIFDTYGFSGQNLLQRPYVLLTSIFLHADATHLLSNIFVLFFFGISLEKEIKALRMLGLFIVGAAFGDILSLTVYAFDSISIGASAGIFAIVGAGIIITPFDMSFYPYVMPVPLGFLGIIYAGYNVIGLFTDPFSQISYIGHFGGLAVGLYYGFKRKGVKQSTKTIIILLILMILIPVLWLLAFRHFIGS